MTLCRDTIFGLLLVCPGLSGAAESALPTLNFDAFGTLGIVHSSEDKADFSPDILKYGSAGYSKAWSADADSILGGQISAQFSDKLEAIAQVIVEADSEGDYTPHLEWAYLQYELLPEVNIRVGRTHGPAFIVSTFRKVGFANIWVRPPVEIYQMVPISALDGIIVEYKTSINTSINTVQLTYGQNDSDFGAGDLVSRDAWGIADTFHIGALTLHGSYQEAMVSVDAMKPLFDGFRQFGPSGIEIADRFEVIGSKSSYIGIGMSYDPGSWFATGEWGSARSNGVFLAKRAWYLSAGYRFGNLTPFITIAQSEATSSPPDNARLETTFLPAAIAAQAEILNAALQDQFDAVPVQDSLSLGLRWDFNSNFALTFQIDHSDIKAQSSGTLINIQPGFKRGESLNLFNVSLDFVFP